MDIDTFKGDYAVTVENTGLRSKFKFWQKLDRNQKISLLFFLFFLLLIPLSTLATFTAVHLRQRATVIPSTPPVIITPTSTLACKADDKGKFSVKLFYKDGYTWLDVNVTAITNYGGAYLCFQQLNLSYPNGFSCYADPMASSPGSPNQWHKEIIEPAGKPYKLIFIVNKLPSDNGEWCGEWYSSSTIPTAIPTIYQCSKAPQNFSVSNPCGINLYRNSSFICQDGYKKEEGSPGSCKNIDIWFQYAKDFCKQRGCLPSPIPTFIPQPSIVITLPPPLTPKPTLSECQKKGGVCCSGDISNCTGGRLIDYWLEGKITTSGGCNPNKASGGSSCCKSCRYSLPTPTN